MTRRHYAMIAQVIKDQRDTTTNLTVLQTTAITARRMANQFALDNPRFNTALFLTACGVQG